MRLRILMVLTPLLLFAGDPAVAQLVSGGAVMSHMGPESFSTPEGRLATWLGAFDEFVAAHPNLSPEQRAAVSKAVELADPALFTDRPSAEARAQMFATLANLQDTLSCGAYAHLLSEFDGVRGWLESNRIVEAGSCLCNSDAQCASGYTCKSTACTSEEGSTNWGTCGSKGDVEVEIELE